MAASDTPGATNITNSSTNIVDPGGASQSMGHQTAPSAVPHAVPGGGNLTTPSAASQVPWGELGQIGPHAVPSGDSGFVSSQAGELASCGGNESTSYSGLSTGPSTGNVSPKAGYDAMKHKGQG